MPAQTIDESQLVREPKDQPRPGVVVVWSGQGPILRALPLRRGRLVLGRDEGAAVARLDDDRLSRTHAEIVLDERKWTIRDLGSRNGTWVDGKRVESDVTIESPKVVRIGRTLLILRRDVRPFENASIGQNEDLVIGPSLHAAFEAIGRAATAGEHLLVTGESGTGKERAAKLFHTRGPNAGGALVAVNCATIPEGVAERLLFGARRGAYSGADNAEGFVAAADHGVLFLDELGELDLDVQAKLLRVLETREVTPLGATTARKVDVKFCFATHRDLRSNVAAKRFREDLYHRIVHPHVSLPPLRDRAEEIPALVTRELARIDSKLSAHITFVEACLARHWPGNVRELLQHVRRAASAVGATGTTSLTVDSLDPNAGLAFEVDSEEDDEPRATLTREAIEQALSAENGNVAATARVLGLHRTQLYRLLRRHGLKSE